MTDEAPVFDTESVATHYPRVPEEHQEAVAEAVTIFARLRELTLTAPNDQRAMTVRKMLDGAQEWLVKAYSA